MAYLIMAGYGAVTFVVLIILMKIFPIVIPKIFDESKWKVKHEIVLIMVIIFFIGVGNFLYTKFIFDFPKNWLKGLLLFEFYTLSVGIIPVVILVMVSRISMLKKNLKAAKNVNESISRTTVEETKNKLITITSDNKNEILKLKPEEFIVAKAEGNYMDVFYTKEDGVKNKMFRSSLKKMKENFFSEHPFFQCHRAYLINIDKITKAEGNSQGFLLNIEYLDFQVPVSRSYVNKFKAIFN